MTCICGHHEKAHLSDIGLCAAPEGCNCNHFRKAEPEPPEELRVDIVLGEGRTPFIRITPSIARRLLAMAQEPTR